MEDKIRKLLWSFLPSPLSTLLTGLGIIIFVYFLIILLDVLDSRDFQRKIVKRIEELNEFREKMRGDNRE